MKHIVAVSAFAVMASCHGHALHAQNSSLVGAISAFKADTMEIEVKPDSGASVAFKVTADTMAQQVAPGVTDLKTAKAMRVTELHLGDRVLATAEPGSTNLRRIVVMSASDLARRDEADRADWARRGVSGLVGSKNGSQIVLQSRSFAGDQQTMLTVTPKTVYRRYAPDSVKFADAKPSGLAEIGQGDQVRARGVKDGATVMAEEVVFGSFSTRAGEIVSVNAAAGEVEVKELAGGKSLTIHFTADSKIKRLLDRNAMIQMMHGPGTQAPQGQGEGTPHKMPAAVMSLNEMLERLPDVRVSDLQAKDLVIVSSTRGTKSDRVTAISMLANAELLLQVMSMQAGGGSPSPAAGLEALSGMGFGVMQ